jgi:hypothetical protein
MLACMSARGATVLLVLAVLLAGSGSGVVLPAVPAIVTVPPAAGAV